MQRSGPRTRTTMAPRGAACVPGWRTGFASVGRALGFFEPLAHALAQAAHGTFGTAQVLADLRRGEALEAQLDDRPFVGIELAKQVFNGLGKDDRLVRSRLTANELAPRFDGIGAT